MRANFKRGRSISKLTDEENRLADFSLQRVRIKFLSSATVRWNEGEEEIKGAAAVTGALAVAVV